MHQEHALAFEYPATIYYVTVLQHAALQCTSSINEKKQHGTGCRNEFLAEAWQVLPIAAAATLE
jgi:hypothetical protein